MCAYIYMCVCVYKSQKLLHAILQDDSHTHGIYLEAFPSTILVCVYNARRRRCIALRFMTRLSLRVSEHFIDPVIDETISFISFFSFYLFSMPVVHFVDVSKNIKSQLTGFIHCFQQKPNSSKSM